MRWSPSASVQLHPWVVGVWRVRPLRVGPDRNSAELLGVDPRSRSRSRATTSAARSRSRSRRRVRVGVTVTREEISRDDSLVKYLAADRTLRRRAGQKGSRHDRARLRRRGATRDRRSVLGGRLEPVSVDQRQLAGLRAARVHRPGAGPIRDHGVVRTPDGRQFQFSVPVQRLVRLTRRFELQLTTGN